MSRHLWNRWRNGPGRCKDQSDLRWHEHQSDETYSEACIHPIHHRFQDDNIMPFKTVVMSPIQGTGYPSWALEGVNDIANCDTSPSVTNHEALEWTTVFRVFSLKQFNGFWVHRSLISHLFFYFSRLYKIVLLITDHMVIGIWFFSRSTISLTCYQAW